MHEVKLEGGRAVAQEDTTARAVQHGAIRAVLSRVNGRVPLGLVARELSRAGVPIFPAVPGEKSPIVTYGLREATTNPRRIDSWWRWQPQANIAIPTGRISGVSVVDIDQHGVDGYRAAKQAIREGLLPAPLAVVRTPTGGRHLYYPAHPEQVQRSWQIADAGVDFRGDGGYVIAPPSALILDKGRTAYAVERVNNAARPVDAHALRDFLDPRPEPAPFTALATGRSADAEALVRFVANRMEGERNAGLFWAACRLAEHGTAPNDALDVLGPAGQRAGLGDREITRTVGSAYRHVQTYGPGRRATVRAFEREPSQASVRAGRGL